MDALIRFIQADAWAIKLTLSILLGVVVTLIEYFLYKKYLPRAKQRGLRWRQIFLSSIHGPFLCYVWLVVATLLLQILVAQLSINSKFIEYISPGRQILTLLFIFWFVMRFIRAWEKSFVNSVENGGKKTFQDTTSVNAIAQLLRVIALVAFLLMLMSAVGLKISTLLAFGGIGGLAISFAAKDTLSNFIGGLMIFWDRPFSVGDWISSPDRNIEGTVTNIGWRLTSIRTFDKRPLYVPNGTFSTISIENPSRMLNRRIKTLVGVRYEDAKSVADIVKAIEVMLREHPEIDTAQTLFVRLVEFGASALNILIYTFTKTTDWVKFQAIQEDVYLKIIDIVTKLGAEFAYPTSTVYLSDSSMPLGRLTNEDVHDRVNTQ